MGQEISRNFNQFANRFNAAIRNQDISPEEGLALEQDVAAIKDPKLNQMARVLVDQARIQTATGAPIAPVALIQDAALEIDMQFSARGRNIVPTGSIHLKQEMMQNLIETLLKSSLNMSEVGFRYDPATSGYTMQGKYQLDYLPDPSFSLTLQPSVQGSQLVFQIQDLKHPGPDFETLSNTVLEAGAKVLSDEGLSASYDPASKRIGIDLNAVLHKVTPLPQSMNIDFSQVSASTRYAGNGNLEIQLVDKASGKLPEGLDSSGYSDLKTSISAGSLKELLRSFLGADLEVGDVKVADGKLSVSAKAYSPELDLLGEGLNIISSLAGGRGVETDGRVPITLSLEPREGARLYFSSSMATGTVAEMVSKLGPKVERDAKGEYYVNFADILKAEEGSIKDLHLSADGIELVSHVNIDHFLKSVK